MLACIPHSPCASFIATMFLACWHAAAFRDHVWKCVSWCLQCPVWLCVHLNCLCLTCSLMGVDFAHCLTAAQGAIVYFTAVLFSALLLSSPFLSYPLLYFPCILLLCSSAPVPTRASIHNSLIVYALDCVVDSSTDFRTKYSAWKCDSSNVPLGSDAWFFMDTFHWWRVRYLCVFAVLSVWVEAGDYLNVSEALKA